MISRHSQWFCIVSLTCLFMVGCTDCSDAPEISDDNATATTPEAPNPTDPTVTPPISNPTELEEPTVQNTEDCDDGIWDGDIRYESDLLAASNCVEINGYIELENVTSITEIDFPVLERINGQILLSELPNLKKAGYETNPQDDNSLKDYRVLSVDISKMTSQTLTDSQLSNKEKLRCKNFFALGLILWAYGKDLDRQIETINKNLLPDNC